MIKNDHLDKNKLKLTIRRSITSYIWLPTILIAFISSFNLKYDLTGISFGLLIIQQIIFLNISFNKQIQLIGIYWTFTLLFLSLFPWLHYSNNALIWRSIPIPTEVYLTTNITLLISNCIIFLIYNINSKTCSKLLQHNYIIKNDNLTILFLTSISSISFFLLLLINDFSFLQLLFRGFIEERRVVAIESSSIALLVGMLTRLTPAFCFFFAISQIKNHTTAKFFLFLIMILSVFPTGVARYMVAFVYIPLALIFIPNLRKSSIFTATLIFSLIFLFPFLDQFRYFSEANNLTLYPSIDFFYAAHFDAYENLASAIEANFVTYGIQLLGSILFFIPRIFWMDKPVGSGYEMAEQQGYSFNNISMPYIGEGFVNFGFLGVFIFSFILAYSLARIDRHFSSIVPTEIINYNQVLYYFLIGALFFMLRGDLLSSTAYISAGVFAWVFIGKAAKWINKKSISL